MTTLHRSPSGDARAPNVQDEIERYLRTGRSDPRFAAWPGDLVACARRGTADLKDALISEVRRRADGRNPPPAPGEVDLSTFSRARLGPLVRGLFPRTEHEPVLTVLSQSIVFLTAENIWGILRDARWLHTAWDIANLYLASVAADLLGPDAERIVGLSEETTCWVSSEYFARNERFADFVVHEAAHIFHNCKRRTIGLPETRYKEWLLPIEFRKRETFAYACEAYARILDLGARPADRRALLHELVRGPLPVDERVDGDEYLDILREAVEARNGWKRIHARCAPERR